VCAALRNRVHETGEERLPMLRLRHQPRLDVSVLPSQRNDFLVDLLKSESGTYELANGFAAGSQGPGNANYAGIHDRASPLLATGGIASQMLASGLDRTGVAGLQVTERHWGAHACAKWSLQTSGTRGSESNTTCERAGPDGLTSEG